MKIKNILKIFVIILFLSSCSSTNKVNTNKANNSSNSLKSKNNTIDDYANYLGVSKKELNNTALYEYIDKWLGVPHKMGGKTKSGIDCSAFVKDIYSEVYQVNIPRTSREMAALTSDKKIKNLNEGDLVFFSFSEKNIDHVGIYLHNNKFVHVSTKKGVIISNLNDIWYYKYVRKSGSLKN